MNHLALLLADRDHDLVSENDSQGQGGEQDVSAVVPTDRDAQQNEMGLLFTNGSGPFVDI